MYIMVDVKLDNAEIGLSILLLHKHNQAVHIFDWLDPYNKTM